MFDVSAGMGFDAAVCQMANTTGTKSFFNKIGLGKLTYGTIAVKELFGAEKVPCEIILDDETAIHVDSFIFAAAMVHHYEGGGFNFAPKADQTVNLIWYLPETCPLPGCFLHYPCLSLATITG